MATPKNSSLWGRLWKWVGVAERLHFLFVAGEWVLANTIPTAAVVAMIVVTWAYLKLLDALYLVLAGLFTFACVVWIGYGVTLWLEKKRHMWPKVTNTQANSYAETISKVFAFNEHGVEQAKEARQHIVRYDSQKAQWQSYIRLELLSVDCSHIKQATPYVVLNLMLRNFLLDPWTLVRIEESEGTVFSNSMGTLSHS